jgi:hypothetical protein
VAPMDCSTTSPSGRGGEGRAGEGAQRRMKTQRECKTVRPHREVPSHLSRRERFFTTHHFSTAEVLPGPA